MKGRLVFRYHQQLLYVMVPGLALFYVLYAFQGFNLLTGTSLSGRGFVFPRFSFGAITSLGLASLFKKHWRKGDWGISRCS